MQQTLAQEEIKTQMRALTLLVPAASAPSGGSYGGSSAGRLTQQLAAVVRKLRVLWEDDALRLFEELTEEAHKTQRDRDVTRWEAGVWLMFQVLIQPICLPALFRLSEG